MKPPPRPLTLLAPPNAPPAPGIYCKGLKPEFCCPAPLAAAPPLIPVPSIPIAPFAMFPKCCIPALSTFWNGLPVGSGMFERTA